MGSTMGFKQMNKLGTLPGLPHNMGSVPNFVMLKDLDDETQQLAYRVCRSVIREIKEK